MQPTLLVLAAGMGSRYGGLKQMDPMGPNGETVLDYSVFDAIRAGFDRVVFIIREDFADAFKQGIGRRFAERVKVDYAFQKLTDLPAGFLVPEGRTKPWGTAHAIRAARDLISKPFAVINADDFYGREAYIKASEFLQGPVSNGSSSHYAMVGYPLENTLSDHGGVNRGICSRDSSGFLEDVEEYLEIAREADGEIRGTALPGNRRPLIAGAPVSMNFWAFTPDIFPQLETEFVDFLQARGYEEKSECYLPSVVDSLIRSGRADCKVLETRGPWFGVTYPADKPHAQASISRLVAAGEYPSPLK